MSYPTNPMHATGQLAVDWELLDSTVEAALIELVGCTDYRGRALTTYLTFPNMWRALKVLVKDKSGDQVVKTQKFRNLESDIFDIRRYRNNVIHADWRDFTEDAELTVVAHDMNTRSSLTAKELRFQSSDINDINNKLIQVHTDLLNFLTNECGIVPFEGKYDLPLQKARDS